MLDLDEIEREVRAWRNPTPALVVALIERLRVAESDREALMEGLGLDPSPEALAEQRAQFGTEGLVWRWRDEIAASERARLEAENARLRAELTDLRDFCDSPHWSHGFESDGVSKWVTCDGRAMVRAMVEDALGE